MSQYRIGFCAMVLSLVSTLRAQVSDQELIRRKRIAESVQKRLPVQVQPTGTAASLDDQKRAAEAMHFLIGSVGGVSRLVKNKPYSAEAVTETVQTLADGNRIVRHNTTKLYRDGAGRTRREQTIEALGPSSPISPGQVIAISDPVASFDYILDPVHRLARKFARFEDVTAQAGVGQPPEGASRVGIRAIESLECTGFRKTAIIPAGQIGNLRPILTVTETWYAPAIEELVHSTTSDPRFGDTSYSLRNIVLGEPARELFEPPPGYDVQHEGPAGGVMKRAR
jgi:hypothetical protein